MLTKPEVLTRNASKVIAALESRDYSQPELGPKTGLSVIELTRAVNYLKSERRVENVNGLLHLRAAAPEAPASEPSADPAPVREIDPTPALVEIPPVETPVVQTSAPVSPPEAAIAGQKSDSDAIPWHRVGTEADAAPAPTLAATVAADGAARLAALIAERDDLKDQLEMARSAGADYYSCYRGAQKGQDTLRAENAQLRRLLDQKKRALRYVAAAGRVNATYLALAKFERANAKATAVAAPVIDTPDLHWSDANTLAYLRKGWSLLTPEDQEEIAVRLLNEIVANGRNNAWFALVRAIQRASEAVQA